MKAFGIFEIKTKLSSICEDVARTGESVLITKRGKPFVKIDPIYPGVDSISPVWEAREKFERENMLDYDFEVPSRKADPVFNPFTEDNN